MQPSCIINILVFINSVEIMAQNIFFIHHVESFWTRDSFIFKCFYKICLLAMLKGDRENTGTETEGCVHFVGETHFDLRCLSVVEKSVTSKFQSWNTTPATPCLCKHNRGHAFYSKCSSGVHTYVDAGEARQATYRLNCSG
jgi:hypothetical protein